METARRSGPGIGVIGLLVKVGGKLLPALLKLLKALKSGKAAMAVASFGTYAILFNWKFALVLIGSLVVHEMGHLWAMRRYGMRTRGLYLIPLLGAAAVSEEAFPSRKAEADIALMGPLWGFGLALVAYAAYLATGEPLAAALAGWMAMLNLFNLLPINPLDGGRLMHSVAHSISSRAGYAFLCLGLAAAFVAAWSVRFGLFTFLAVIGAMELLGERRQMRRRIDHERITRALAEGLGLPPGPRPEDVIGRIMSVHRQLLAGATAMFPHRLLDADPFTGRFGPREWADHFVERLRRTALAARIERRTTFRRRPYHVTDGSELGLDLRGDPCAGRTLDDTSPLFSYLRTRPKEAMSPSRAALAFAAYAVLASALAALMFATAHVPAAEAALKVFQE